MYIKIFNFAYAKLIYTHSIFMKKYVFPLMCICLCTACSVEVKTEYKTTSSQKLAEDSVEAAFLAEEEDWEDDWEEELEQHELEQEAEEDVDDIELPELSDPDFF